MQEIDAMDTSMSFRGRLPTALAFLSQEVALHRPEWLTLYRFDASVTLLSDRQALAVGKRLIKDLVPFLQPVSKKDGTYFENLLTTIADRIEASHAAQIRVVLWSDGINDAPPSSWREIQVQMNRIARDPRVKQFLLIGVRPPWCDPWNKSLMVLGGRFAMLTDTEMRQSNIDAEYRRMNR